MVKRIDYSTVGIKTTAIILFCLALLFSALIAITGAGKVQAANPTVITTPQELNNIRHDMEGDYVLGNNINLNVGPYNTGAGWDPIGDRYDLGNFKGTFDGKGFTISGLMVDRPSSNGGLFGLTSGTSKFSNVKLVDVNIKTGHSVGGLLGEIGNGGLIENVHVTGTLSGADNVGGVAGSLTNAKIKNSSANVNITSTSRAGGLIGYSGGDAAIIEDSTSAGTVMSTGRGVGGLTGVGSTVINSSSSANVTSTHNGGSSDVGGLIGRQSVFEGEVTKSFATGAVAVSNGENVGGLIGYLVASTTSPVKNSYATGTVTGLQNVGGLVGQNNGITISDSYATGEVFGEDAVGGLIGYHLHNDALVERSYSESKVIATGNNVGGLIGETKDAPKIIDTYARGNVAGNQNVGGLVGFNPAGTIHRSYATGKVTGASNEGGLVGNDVHGKFSPQAPNFYDSQTTEQFDSTGGAGLLTSVMMDIENKTSTYPNWNFTSVWDMEPNDYPIFAAFGDISNHWGKAQIKEAAERGLITGYEDRTFKPENSITRAQFIVIIDRAIDMDGNEPAPNFNDHDQIQGWAKDAIERAVKSGIVGGYEDGTFQPNKVISREEIAKIVSEAFKLQRTSNGSTGFADDSQIQNWAKDYVAALEDHKIVTGKGGNKFAPKADTKRAEGATILLRALKN